MKYEPKQKIDMTVTYKGFSEYAKSSYTGYGYDTVTINKFEDEEGNLLVWKTTVGIIFKDIEVPLESNPSVKEIKTIMPNSGAIIRIKGTVKSIGEYKGQPQVELTRVKMVDLIEQAKTREEIIEERREEQVNTVKFTEGDTILTMTYKNYKEHYADCETVIGSFMKAKNRYSPATISVIVRAGRLKESGTRGEHFNTYVFKNENGECMTYRAICKANATKRINKEFAGHSWEVVKVWLWEPKETYNDLW